MLIMDKKNIFIQAIGKFLLGDLLKAVQEYMGQAEPIDDITLMTICKKEFIGPK